ncbi:MAG: hypothetical protein AAF317_03525 [Pseudomonadota bacterium]
MKPDQNVADANVMLRTATGLVAALRRCGAGRWITWPLINVANGLCAPTLTLSKREFMVLAAMLGFNAIVSLVLTFRAYKFLM